jgi:hypothetical protein
MSRGSLVRRNRFPPGQTAIVDGADEPDFATERLADRFHGHPDLIGYGGDRGGRVSDRRDPEWSAIHPLSTSVRIRASTTVSLANLHL